MIPGCQHWGKKTKAVHWDPVLQLMPLMQARTSRQGVCFVMFKCKNFAADLRRVSVATVIGVFFAVYLVFVWKITISGNDIGVKTPVVTHSSLLLMTSSNLAWAASFVMWFFPTAKHHKSPPKVPQLGVSARQLQPGMWAEKLWRQAIWAICHHLPPYLCLRS